MENKWSCPRCTYINVTSALQCDICLTKNISNISSTDTKKHTIKRQKTAKMQSLLVSVGSSKEQEAKRLEKKIMQMRELGITLTDPEIIPLLARNCYCVHVAASEYFETMATSDTPTAVVPLNQRILNATAYYKSGQFISSPFRLLGTTQMDGAITRTSVSLHTGDKLIFQGENIGKKRGRSSPSPVSTSSEPMPTSSATSLGIVRISTMKQNVQVGWLSRDMETVYHPLLKERLVTLGGICETPPTSSAVFASFKILVFVFIHPCAFEIFQEDHPLFHLSDALYSVLDTIHSGTGGTTSLTSALRSANGNEDTSEAVPGDLDALFSAFTGSRDEFDTSEQDPSEPLSQYLKSIELRNHQKQALFWMLQRETPIQIHSKGEGNVNPLWEQRLFDTKESYYINPFEKIASLVPPPPASPCRGGILADDMGMGKTMMMLCLIAYRKYVSSSNDQGSTLIVCPLSLLHQWKQEIENRFVSQTLSVFVYYGDDRDLSRINTDVVLTTYGVLTSEYDKPNKGLLLSTDWNRVILDEAHSIKNRNTIYFKSSLAISATHRWCLTGTPLQNSLEDLYSLLCFLQCQPWSRLAWWTRVITRPFEQGDENALVRLKVILQPLLLRRTKRTLDRYGKSIVDLPAKTIQLVRLQLRSEERAFYQAVYDRSRAEFNGFVASGSTMSNYMAIFALLLRLRQACNHPLLALGRDSKQVQDTNASVYVQREANETVHNYFMRIATQLQSPSQTPSSYIQNVLTQIQEEGIEAQECPVCLDPPHNGVLTSCAHLLCEMCLRQSIQNDPENGCPVCRVPVQLDEVYSLTTQHDKHVQDVSSLYMSSKLEQLLQDLELIRQQDQDEKQKVVVFSQWTHMLEMIGHVLSRNGFGHVIFHGGMTLEKRQHVLSEFTNNPSIDVLVISLKAGGVGLNLTRASFVILFDPWWNPSIEEQAIDRVHRLGQTRSVLVKRYIVQESVEEMMLQLQARKQTLAQHVLGTTKSINKGQESLQMEDLLAFFQ